MKDKKSLVLISIAFLLGGVISYAVSQYVFCERMAAYHAMNAATYLRILKSGALAGEAHEGDRAVVQGAFVGSMRGLSDSNPAPLNLSRLSKVELCEIKQDIFHGMGWLRRLDYEESLKIERDLLGVWPELDVAIRGVPADIPFVAECASNNSLNPDGPDGPRG